MTSEHTSSKDYFFRLDILRFFAFFVVFINHITAFLKTPSSVWEPKSWSWTLFQIGDIGVGFFFVLSGFLITYLLEKEFDRTKSISFRKFYIRRVLRIWPLYFLVIILVCLISLFTKNFDVLKTAIVKEELLCYVFLLGNIYRAFWDVTNDMIAVLWSIAVEEQFYLVWPLLFFLFRKYIGVRGVVFVTMCGLFISLYHRFVYAGTFEIREFYTFSIMGYLFVGALIGSFSFLYREVVVQFVSKYGSYFWKIATLASLIILFIRGSILGDASNAYFSVVSLLVFALSFGLIIMIAAFAESKKENKNMIRMKEKMKSFFVHLGKISYGLYVYHLIVLTVLLRLLNIQSIGDEGLSVWKFIPLSILILGGTIGIAHLSYTYIEQPFLRLKERFI